MEPNLNQTWKEISSNINPNELYSNFQEFLKLQHLYNAAVKLIQTRLEVLNDEFNVLYARNPIHHIESRLKSTSSIVAKLQKKGYPISIEAAMKNINDIAGIRVVCCYIDDVYRVEEMLLRKPYKSCALCISYREVAKRRSPQHFYSSHRPSLPVLPWKYPESFP